MLGKEKLFRVTVGLMGNFKVRFNLVEIKPNHSLNSQGTNKNGRCHRQLENHAIISKIFRSFKSECERLEHGLNTSNHWKDLGIVDGLKRSIVGHPTDLKNPNLEKDYG